MTTVFQEGSLQFSFDDQWNVIKYDKESDYREKIQKIAKTEAVDFLGIRESELYFLEVKGFRDYRIETQRRLTSGELVLEVAQKVRDTIAGVIAANRTSSEPQKWHSFTQHLSNPSRPIRVVLWLEYDLPAYQKARSKVEASVHSQQLKKAVKWLTPYAFITGVNANSSVYQGLQVSNLPR